MRISIPLFCKPPPPPPPPPLWPALPIWTIWLPVLLLALMWSVLCVRKLLRERDLKIEAHMRAQQEHVAEIGRLRRAIVNLGELTGLPQSDSAPAADDAHMDAPTEAPVLDASSSGLLSELSVLSPLLAALSAESLLAATCVSHAWAAAATTDKAALWRALVFSRWPALVGLSSVGVNWQTRYRVLARQGELEHSPDDDEVDPLARYTFIVQCSFAGRGREHGFSLQAAAHRAQCDVGMDGRHIVIKDALQLEVSMPGGLPLPISWREPPELPADRRENAASTGPVGDAVGGGSGLEGDSTRTQPDHLQVHLLIHDSTHHAVAHLLSFDIRKEDVTQSATSIDAPLHEYLGLQERAPFGTEFTAEVRGVDVRTNVGVGVPGPDGLRATPPWMAKMTDVDATLIMPEPPRAEACPISLGFSTGSEAEPDEQGWTWAARLTSLRFGVALRAVTIAGVIDLPLQISTLPLIDDVDWA